MAKRTKHRELWLGGDAYVDLPKLIDTRLLVQANSGGGKSWFLRMLCEHAGPWVQTMSKPVEPKLEVVETKIVEKLVVKDSQIERIAKVVERAETMAKELRDTISTAKVHAKPVALAARGVGQAVKPRDLQSRDHGFESRTPHQPESSFPIDVKLGKAERKISRLYT